MGVAIFAAGVLTSAGIFYSARKADEAAVANAFQAEARGWRDGAQTEVNRFFAVLNSIRSLHDLSDRITPEDLRELIAKGMQYQQETLGIFGFAQELSDEHRAEFESTPLATKASGYAVTEISAVGDFVTANRRREYFPILFESPETGLGFPVGYDLASVEPNRLGIDRMRRTGSSALGAPVGLRPGETGRLAFSPIMTPVYDAESQRFLIYMRGFAFGLLLPREILRRALPAERAAEVQVVFAPREAMKKVSHPGGLSLDETVSVADEAWVFRVDATAGGYLERRRSREPITLFGAGVVVSLLLGVLGRVLAERTARTNELVRERTAELRVAQAETLRIARDEQERLGRDLHDSLGQKLTGAVFLSRSLMSDVQGEAQESAAKLNEMLKDAVAQTRLMARGLSPVDVGEDGLPNALRRLADEATEVYGVACSFREEGRPAGMSGESATHLFQIAQEGLTNAIRHGEPSEVVVRLGREGISIEDDGRGFDVGGTVSRGAGLRIMRYRAELAGGRLEVESRAGRTVVRARMG